jgi:hypothetical protein
MLPGECGLWARVAGGYIPLITLYGSTVGLDGMKLGRLADMKSVGARHAVPS